MTKSEAEKIRSSSLEDNERGQWQRQRQRDIIWRTSSRRILDFIPRQ